VAGNLRVQERTKTGVPGLEAWKEGGRGSEKQESQWGKRGFGQVVLRKVRLNPCSHRSGKRRDRLGRKQEK